ncbi:hypothetical protein HN51_065076 [Arachis hypogaea]|uniref:cysteine proteinase inhibitor 5-like n=1 Tax=Arachis ipaensis TaxID=130454 RepID=UPI0007AF4459|nr:cysteine proteinase inhibitor 5-like [Arachis ipaensis]XP_025645996.1 cysteine proteinase inhibitor 5 [Arachis hypogaea]QHO06180.1 Cysteine proteinase inhibitor [Arachis hypogaea]
MVSMKQNYLLLLSLLSLLFLSACFSALATSRPPVALGGRWTHIKDAHKNLRAVATGEFAVKEYNKQSGTNLTFVQVVKGDTQVVDGTNFRLVLAVEDEKSKKMDYEAVVWEDIHRRSRNLTSFRALLQ